MLYSCFLPLYLGLPSFPDDSGASNFWVKRLRREA